MIYPMVKDSDKIHIVKDINMCACGVIYNSDIVVKRKTLRKIKFIDLGKVTCESCVSKLLKFD